MKIELHSYLNIKTVFRMAYMGRMFKNVCLYKYPYPIREVRPSINLRTMGTVWNIFLQKRLFKDFGFTYQMNFWTKRILKSYSEVLVENIEQFYYLAQTLLYLKKIK